MPAHSTQWWQRHQIGVYLAAVLCGAVTATAAPSGGRVLENIITPLLAALLYTTFVQVPARQLAHSLRNKRFLTAALGINFILVPLVVAGIWRFLPHDDAIRIGVLLVLLTPCIDYVVAFTQLAGGASHILLAATPLLLLTQMLLLPAFLWLFMGPQLATTIDAVPFVNAFVMLIVIPLTLAWATQAATARHAGGQRIIGMCEAAAVPLMAATLTVVVASQTPKLDGATRLIGTVAPAFFVFLAAMAVIGWVTARLFRFDTATGRALIFTGATRNSLVVLPLALAIPEHLAAAAVVVVTQTLVEIIGMIAYIGLVPVVLPTPSATRTLR